MCDTALRFLTRVRNDTALFDAAKAPASAEPDNAEEILPHTHDALSLIASSVTTWPVSIPSGNGSASA